MTIFNALTLIGGLAMYLYGMNVMCNGLENSQEESLKNSAYSEMTMTHRTEPESVTTFM